MKKNSLTVNKGLSLSQAQSVSNLCNQRALEIEAVLTGINNYSKTVEVLTPTGSKELGILAGKELPSNVVDLILEKAKLHACQAFLMENIRAKDAMLKQAKSEHVDISDIVVPEKPRTVSPLINQLSEVSEEFGWSQLSAGELNEFIEAEAFAAHIGQFIHLGKPLDLLRKELPKLPKVEWMELKQGEKTPVYIYVHHTSEGLMKVHEELAAKHREYEQKCNYFKAKVKNLTTAENARIAKVNADAQGEAEDINNKLQSNYETAFNAYSEKVKSIHAEFEKTRQNNIKEIAAMRIEIDSRFQSTIDSFLSKLPDSQD